MCDPELLCSGMVGLLLQESFWPRGLAARRTRKPVPRARCWVQAPAGISCSVALAILPSSPAAGDLGFGSLSRLFWLLHHGMVGAHVLCLTELPGRRPTSFVAVLVVSFCFPLPFRGAHGMESVVLSGQLICLLSLAFIGNKKLPVCLKKPLKSSKTPPC